jgi:hypothetical protein
MGSFEQAREAILTKIAELAPHMDHPESLRHLAEALATAGSAQVPASQRVGHPRRAAVV